MTPYLQKTIDFTVQYAEGLVKDVAEERMAEQPANVPNHPAWTLGHLVVSNAFLLSMLGGKAAVPETWGPLFGPGSKPTTDRSQYPTKAELLDALRQTTQAVSERVSRLTDEELKKANPNEKLAGRFPTMGDLVLFLTTAHPTMHLGQLSSWRRAAGLPSVF